MELLRPRHLRFEDVSGTLRLNSLQPSTDQHRASQSASKDDTTASIVDQGLHLSSLASKLQDAHDSIQERVERHKKSALEQLEATGGRQALESHLKAQKANWKFIGQKEAFLDCLKALNTSKKLLQHDFSADIATADKAVQALKEDIRDRHGSISQTEQDLHDMITQLTRLYGKSKSTASELALQLPIMAKELEDRRTKRQQPPEPTVEGMNEAELERLLELEEKRAAELEEEAARAAATRAAEETKRAMLEDTLRVMRAEVAAAEEECSAAAEKAGARYKADLQRFEMLASLLSRITGAELSAQEECVLNVTLTQAIPRGMDSGDGAPCAVSATGAGAASARGASGAAPQPMDVDSDAAGVVVVDHLLSLVFEAPESVALRTATLTPPEIDIEPHVREAQAAQNTPGKDASSALVRLVQGITAHLRRHCRRQLQLEDAHELYPLQPTSVSPQVLRCVLPNKVEVEVLVPMSWPEDSHMHLQLLRLEAPRTSQDLGALLARLQRDVEEANLCPGPNSASTQAELLRRRLRGCSLRDFLGWVYSNVATELGA